MRTFSPRSARVTKKLCARSASVTGPGSTSVTPSPASTRFLAASACRPRSPTTSTRARCIRVCASAPHSLSVAVSGGEGRGGEQGGRPNLPVVALALRRAPRALRHVHAYVYAYPMLSVSTVCMMYTRLVSE